MNNLIFMKLDDEQLALYTTWARRNYRPGDPVDELWHPAARVECERMNLEQVQGQPGGSDLHEELL